MDGQDALHHVSRDFRPKDTALNGICPYFTMFPLDFPGSSDFRVEEIVCL